MYRFVGLKGVISKWRELKHYPNCTLVLYVKKEGHLITIIKKAVVVPSITVSDLGLGDGIWRIRIRPYEKSRPLTMAEVKDFILHTVNS